MKSKFILIFLSVIVCSTATAIYTDNPNNCGVLHCDTVITNLLPDGTNYWLVTPDDNSSGCTAIIPILNISNNWSFGMILTLKFLMILLDFLLMGILGSMDILGGVDFIISEN